MRPKTLSGFGWDGERGIITGPEEVWAMEIMVSCYGPSFKFKLLIPGVIEFRDKPIADAVELGEIFDGVQATVALHRIQQRSLI